MPAIAAAFGVLKFARVSVSSGVMLAFAIKSQPRGKWIQTLR